MKRIFATLAAVVLLASCEKEITIDLNSSDPQIVIEGSITDEPGPYFVKITRSVNFSDSNDYPPISGAEVIISDNLGNIDQLSEVSAGVYQTNTIVGTPGTTYFLSVTADEKDFSAITTMPEKVNLDSLKFEPFNGPDGDYSVLPVYKDPSTPGNNYRFLLYVNGELDDSYFGFNDNIDNGLVNQRSIFSTDSEIYADDSVTVEMRCIDSSTYTYFYTLSQFTGGGPIGGTTPTNPPNNIEGDSALGFFAAYTTQTKVEKAPQQ